MKQVMPFSWDVVSEKGFALQKGITCETLEQATQYIKNYTSSFNGWIYEVAPLKKD